MNDKPTTTTRRIPRNARDCYHMRLDLTTEELAACRKGQHEVEARSLSAFVRDCISIRLESLARNSDPWKSLLDICGLTEEDLNAEAQERIRRMTNPILRRGATGDPQPSAIDVPTDFDQSVQKA